MIVGSPFERSVPHPSWTALLLVGSLWQQSSGSLWLSRGGGGDEHYPLSLTVTYNTVHKLTVIYYPHVFFFSVGVKV